MWMTSLARIRPIRLRGLSSIEVATAKKIPAANMKNGTKARTRAPTLER
jgi:hypothetical protein